MYWMTQGECAECPKDYLERVDKLHTSDLETSEDSQERGFKYEKR